MTTKEAVALLERYSNYDGMGIPNLAGCKEAMKVAVDALKEAYPELAESEDERIRKAIIHYILYETKGAISEATEHTWVKWLEKQKEPENVSASTIVPSCWEVKQKEQKPVERSREDNYIIGFVYALLNQIEWKDNWAMSKEECLRRLNNYIPQKPAEWSAKGRRGRIGSTPEHIRKKAENFLSKMEPPYDADDICTAYEAGALESAKPALDEIDQWLFDSFGILPGCCSSIESVKHTTARMVAEALWPKKEVDQIPAFLDSKNL